MMWHRRFSIFALGTGSLLAWWLFLWGLPPRLFLKGDDLNSYRVLTNARFYAGPHVGIGGDEPDTMRAFRRIARHPRAGRLFKHVLVQGSFPAKMYALTGLRRTDPGFFQVAMQPFRLWPGTVYTAFGCLMETVPVRRLLVTNEPPAVQLKRGETLEEWCLARRLHTEPWSIDISGGGYTSLFLDEPARPPAAQLQPAADIPATIHAYAE